MSTIKLTSIAGELDTNQELTQFLDALRGTGIEPHLAKPFLVSFVGELGDRYKISLYFTDRADLLVRHLLKQGSLKRWEKKFKITIIDDFRFEPKAEEQ